MASVLAFWSAFPPATRRNFLAGSTVAVASLLAPWCKSRAADELNILVWCDNADAKLLTPFEETHGIRVNAKVFEESGEALSIIEQSQPGDWDVLVLDSQDIVSFAKRGILAELPQDAFTMGDFFPEVLERAPHHLDGKMYAMPEAYGFQGLAFNRDKVDADDLRSIEVLWNPKYKGRVGIYDFYVTSVQLIAISLGIKPDQITLDHIPAIRERLFSLKPQIVLAGDIVAVQNALVTGSVDIVLGGAEFVVSGLTPTHPFLRWIIPEEGGLQWMQGIGIFADSTRRDLALEFVKHILSPLGQGLLATSECFWAMPSNTKAVLTDEQKEILRWDEQPHFLSITYPYPFPEIGSELDKAMLDVWSEFLQA